MKILIYITGIGSGILIVSGTWGVLFEQPLATAILIFGLVLAMIFFSLLFIEKHRQDKKINEIIKSHKGDKYNKEEEKHPHELPKGWGMNDSPYRERKSGLEWTGGNIKGLTAKRTSRKKFMGK